MATSCSRPATATAPTSPAPCRPNARNLLPICGTSHRTPRDFAVSGGEDPVSAAMPSRPFGRTRPARTCSAVKPAMDILWVNACELLSPGFTSDGRQPTNRERDYGQTRFSPQTLGDFAR